MLPLLFFFLPFLFFFLQCLHQHQECFGFSEFKFKSQVILHFFPGGCQEKPLSDILLWLKTPFFRVSEINVVAQTTDEAIFRYWIFGVIIDFSIKKTTLTT